MNDSSVSTAAPRWIAAATTSRYGDRTPDWQGVRPLGSRTATQPIRTGETDACADELDRLLASEFQDSRSIERGFCDREITRGARDRTANSSPSQEDQFYLHRLYNCGWPVEFAVSLQATSECEPRTILRLLRQNHVLDPGCQHGRRLYVLVHSGVPLLTRR